MKKILLAVTVLFLSSACYANNTVEQQILPINEVVTQPVIQDEKMVEADKPSLRESDVVDEVKAVAEDSATKVQITDENGNYNADTGYLLEKIESFTPIDINKKVIIKTIDESAPSLAEDLIIDEVKSVATPVVIEKEIIKDTPKPVKFEDKVAMTRLYCKFDSAAVLKQPKTNLTWIEKFRLKRYFKRIAKKEFGSIYYSGSRKSIARIKVVIDRNGKVVKTKIVESNYNKEFNKQIIQQMKDMQLPKFNISVQEIVAIYHFDNIKLMDE